MPVAAPVPAWRRSVVVVARVATAAAAATTTTAAAAAAAAVGGLVVVATGGVVRRGAPVAVVVAVMVVAVTFGRGPPRRRPGPGTHRGVVHAGAQPRQVGWARHAPLLPGNRGEFLGRQERQAGAREGGDGVGVQVPQGRHPEPRSRGVTR